MENKRVLSRLWAIADQVKLEYPITYGSVEEKAQLNIKCRKDVVEQFKQLLARYNFQTMEQALMFLISVHNAVNVPEPHKPYERRLR